MNVALDMNAYSDFLRGDPARVEIVRQADRIHLPIIVLGELRAGFAAGTRETENLATLRRFLASPRVPCSLSTKRQRSIMPAFSFNSAGKALPFQQNDLWIAALVIQHDLNLCSSDAHFQHVAGLRLC